MRKNQIKNILKERQTETGKTTSMRREQNSKYGTNDNSQFQPCDVIVEEITQQSEQPFDRAREIQEAKKKYGRSFKEEEKQMKLEALPAFQRQNSV